MRMRGEIGGSEGCGTLESKLDEKGISIVEEGVNWKEMQGDAKYLMRW